MFINQIKNRNHSHFMKLALLQAQRNLANTNENPSVGCVITQNNSVISVGSTSIKGRPHAEQNAISKSKVNLKGADLYVTMEPVSYTHLTLPTIYSV